MVVSGFVMGLAPVVAFAQIVTGGTNASCSRPIPGSLEFILCKIGQLLNSIIPILIALGVVYFVWGVITYVIASDEEAKKTGRDRIIYGIIGLAVIVGVWGLVNVVKNTFFNVGNNANIQLPTVPVVIPQ